MKQTAVEWLISQQKHNSIFNIETIEQAKEMEKEQMCNHFRQGYMFCNSPILSAGADGEIITSTMKYYKN